MDILSILLGILIFFLIILIHEVGHFTVAKLCRMKVKEFAIGMGPKILKKQIGDTVYALKALPIGGSVSLDEDIENDDPHSFRNRPVWMRILVIAAGAFMNFVLGFIFCIISTLCSSSIASTTVAGFHPGAVSSQQLQKGDVICDINGMSIFTTMDISFQLTNTDSHSLGSPYYVYNFKVERDGQMIELNDVKFASRAYAVLISEYKQAVGDREGYPELPTAYFDISSNEYTEEYRALEENDPQLAAALKTSVDKYIKDYPDEEAGFYLDFIVLAKEMNFFNVIENAAASFVSYGRLIWISFLYLINGTYGLNEMSGPIGVVQSVSTVAAFGWSSLMSLAAMIAINVGIVNLLPIPAMDGGRLVFLIIEAIRRKPIKAEHEGMVHFIGIVLLMLLMVVVTFNDIMRIFSGG